MKSNTIHVADFEMIIEGDNTFLIKKVQPENLTDKEKAEAEKNSPKVLLHYFDQDRISELQKIAEKLSKKYFENSVIPHKHKKSLGKAIKSFFLG